MWYVGGPIFCEVAHWHFAGVIKWGGYLNHPCEPRVTTGALISARGKQKSENQRRCAQGSRGAGTRGQRKGGSI